ncbi:MAG: 23S rRNA (adenine(2503)-C(2))-methyltransferase RlmN [Clostridium sp.]|nr:23S rRNA (adenine(2503)-C(2))-methyltransferase RlmN [Clostridium sp.]MCM1547295.1 23S rRNA (adenine(2503)-C(2))-methyltransferase RlmN [Ruminococcus sp.]
MKKIDILSMSLSELEAEIMSMGEKKFRAKQIFEWLHVKKVTDFSEMSNLSVQFRGRLSEKFCVNQLFVARKLESSIDNTVKYLYRLSDGCCIETVLMEYKHGLSLCVSAQVGCKMGCRFCASTIAGFERNLEPSEILGQVYQTERESGKRISGIVLMGIGEPLDNFRNVIKFLELVSAPEGNNLSLRHVTLSTCGIVPKIKELTKLDLGLTLSVSLHCPDDKGRSEIMPINDRYNIKELIRAAEEYTKLTGRRVTYEYAVIDGVNSDKESAVKLASLLHGMNCHVNLIPVNAVKERNYRSSRNSAVRFSGYLTDMGINSTVRRTLGSDIDAACGQLRREAMK